MSEPDDNIKFINENQSPRDKLAILQKMGIRTTPQGEKELNLWDKKRWLVIEDFWAERITQEHADARIEEINAEEEKANTPSDDSEE